MLRVSVARMKNLPTIVGLPPDGNVQTMCNRITRVHLLIAAVVLLGILSLSLIITVGVQAHKSSSSSTDKKDYCLSDGCLSAASYQLRSMDKNVSSKICTDFYSYACGGWERTHSIQAFDVERTILGDILNRRDAEIERLLSEPIARPLATSWEYKLKVSSVGVSSEALKREIGFRHTTVNVWTIILVYEMLAN